MKTNNRNSIKSQHCQHKAINRTVIFTRFREQRNVQAANLLAAVCRLLQQAAQGTALEREAGILATRLLR